MRLVEFQLRDTVVILDITGDEREVVVNGGCSNEKIIGIFGQGLFQLFFA